LSSDGLDGLEDYIAASVYDGKVYQKDSLFVTNARHKDALNNAASEVKEAIAVLNESKAVDLTEINVKAAFDYLGEITGETVTDDILDRVFSRFCVGK
jgi:tRNA modification GTPase